MARHELDILFWAWVAVAGLTAGSLIGRNLNLAYLFALCTGILSVYLVVRGVFRWIARQLRPDPIFTPQNRR